MKNCVGREKISMSKIPRMLYSNSTVYKDNNNIFLHTGDVICSITECTVYWHCRSFHGLIEKVLHQYITDSFYLDAEQHLITYTRNCVCEINSTEPSLSINYFKADVIIILSKARGYIIRLEKEIGYVLNTKDHIGFIDMDLPRVMKTLSDISVYSLCF
jgi:hypothetical protein